MAKDTGKKNEKDGDEPEPDLDAPTPDVAPVPGGDPRGPNAGLD